MGKKQYKHLIGYLDENIVSIISSLTTSNTIEDLLGHILIMNELARVAPKHQLEHTGTTGTPTGTQCSSNYFCIIACQSIYHFYLKHTPISALLIHNQSPMANQMVPSTQFFFKSEKCCIEKNNTNI